MTIFNEDSLREEIVEKWGPAGAHIDVYDALVKHDKNAMKLLTEAWHMINSGLFPGKGKKRDEFLAKITEFQTNPFMEV